MHNVVTASILLFFTLMATSCNTNSNHKSPTSEELKVLTWPKWVTQGNIYEVNIRQFTDFAVG